jgi:hypothetical protein
MPALYIPKAGAFDGLLSQLETIKVLRPDDYLALQQNYRLVNATALEEKIPAASITLLQLTALALQQDAFRQAIETTYINLKKSLPTQTERLELTRWQQEIKTQPSLEQRGLDLQGQKDFCAHLHQRLLQQLKKTNPHATNTDVLIKLQQDAKTLHQMLTPSVKITRQGETVTEAPYSLAEYFADPPDMIFIMGNNDLRQVDQMAMLYRRAKLHSPLRYPTFYISGFGGHGTMHDPVFARQEGETMAKRLRDLGVPAKDIRIEHDAVDTGRNVKYMDIYLLMAYALRQNRLNPEDHAFLKQLMAMPGRQKRTPEEEARLDAILAPIKTEVITNDIVLFQNILVSGTPGGLRRQTSTAERQKQLPWQHLTCLAPDEFQEPFTDSHYYYGTLPHALINFIYALREVASFLDYTVNSNYLSKRPLPDTDNLRQCIRLFADYYNLLREKKYDLSQQRLFQEKRIDGDQLAKLFIDFNHEKNHELTATLNSMIKPTANYFRRAFADIEVEKLHQVSLRRRMPLAEQAGVLDTAGTYSRLTIR